MLVRLRYAYDVLLMGYGMVAWGVFLDEVSRRHRGCSGARAPSEVHGRSRALHMWQLGSKLKTSCRLYFDCPPSLCLPVYTVLQIGKQPCVYIIKPPENVKMVRVVSFKTIFWEEYHKVSSPSVNYVAKSKIQIARSVFLLVSHKSEAHAHHLSGRGFKISCVCN